MVKLKNKYFMFFIICILIINLVGCETTVKTNSTNKSDKDNINSYIKSNIYSVDLEKNYDKLLDSVHNIKDYKIILCGETHNYGINENLKLAFLKCISNKTNLKYYIGEFDYVTGIYYNKYLQSGSEKDLQLLGKVVPTPTNEWYEQTKEMYKFYKSLPQNKKFTVVGIDILCNSEYQIKYLNLLIKNKKIPSNLSILNGLSNNKLCLNEKSLNDYVIKLKKDMDSKPKEYKKLLGKNLFYFKMVVDNMFANYKFEENYNGHDENPDILKIRDKQITENFNNINKRLPKGVYFGQWGWGHTSLHKSIFENFVSNLNSDKSQFKNKILSIKYDYYGIDDDKLSTMASSYCKSNIALLNLNGNKSPFRSRLKWNDCLALNNTIQFNDKYENLPLEKYFQIVIFINSYKECVPKKF